MLHICAVAQKRLGNTGLVYKHGKRRPCLSCLSLTDTSPLKHISDIKRKSSSPTGKIESTICAVKKDCRKQKMKFNIRRANYYFPSAYEHVYVFRSSNQKIALYKKTQACCVY